MPAAAGLSHYEVERQYADGRAVSRLSPYLHFGQLSPRLVMRELEKNKAEQARAGPAPRVPAVMPGKGKLCGSVDSSDLPTCLMPA